MMHNILVTLLVYSAVQPLSSLNARPQHRVIAFGISDTWFMISTISLHVAWCHLTQIIGDLPNIPPRTPVVIMISDIMTTTIGAEFSPSMFA